MSDHIIITGVPGHPAAGADPATRVEINDFVNDEKAFSLYIQALWQMYNISQTDDSSHFQVGGIHGLPYTPWEGSGSDQPVGDWGGYCTHGCVVFPTWHRPYVALYEQLLQAHAVQIASTYTSADKADWQNAALNWRLPYWDWAVNAIPPAQIISEAQVTITGPDGQQQQVDNPCLAYPFNPIDSSFQDTPYAVWPTTLRHPTDGTPNATSNVNEMKQYLRGDQTNITSNTYNLLSRISTWPAFSNHTVGDGGSQTTSLEGIHDTIHGDVGANGHMGDPSVAAFDPIFFLHHCNVDRMLALWQALHPTTWVSPGPSEGGTFTISDTATDDTNTGLTPFWNSATGYWTSTEARNFETALNYTYPEFKGLNMGNANAVKTAIAAKVNQLYGSTHRRMFAAAAVNTGSLGNVTTEALVENTPPTQIAPVQAQQLFTIPSGATAATSAHPAQVVQPAQPAQHAVQAQSVQAAQAPHAEVTQAIGQHPIPGGDHEHDPGHPAGDHPHKYYEWAARIHCKKHELNGSYSVLIFLGDPPQDPKEWRTSPNYVGAHHVFANSVSEKCENCRNRSDDITEGFVILNTAIAHAGLPTFDVKDVQPYLTKNLHWRVQQVNGDGADISQVPSLQVTATAIPLTLHVGEAFPRAGRSVHHHSITAGRPGGHLLD